MAGSERGMRPILVTGAAGFIGYHTARALLERGDAVIGLDNLNDYYDPRLNGVDWPAIRDKYRPRVAGAKTDAQFYLALKSMARELNENLAGSGTRPDREGSGVQPGGTTGQV